MTRTDAKEEIAAMIFDRDWTPPESRPTEEVCHEIADSVLNFIELRVMGSDVPDWLWEESEESE